MQIESELLKIVSGRFIKAFDRINHGIDQLNDHQIWHRPSSNSNSIGIIIQHLNGNLNQWICSAIGGEVFHRNRRQEFKETEHISKRDIIIKTDQLKEKISGIISQIPAGSLLSYRRIQGFDETVMSALITALTHLELHAGQIIYITKLILGNNYKESWKPANPEQGKE
jgi:hypothetical protein